MFELVTVGVRVGCLPVSFMENESREVDVEEEVRDELCVGEESSEDVVDDGTGNSDVDEVAALLSNDDEGP